MATEFGEIIKDEYESEYKYITPCLKVYKDGEFARYNTNTDEWEDEEGDKRGLISYFNRKTKTASKESKSKLVARAFIPNPKKKKSVKYIDGNKNNCCLDNLEWGVNKKEEKTAVGYTIEGDNYQVRMYCPIAKKTKFYGSYDTQAEAEAKVAEIKNINLKN